MSLWRSLEGMVEVVLTSADLNDALDTIGKYGIAVQDALYMDRLRIRFIVSNYDLPRLMWLAQKRGENIEILQRRGLYFTLKSVLKRPVLLIGFLCIFWFSCWIPTRVFFVRVEGNSAVSAQRIIEQAELCGIGFGTSRREIRSERIKNQLLEAMPQLQWAGVNTYGCTAVITVRERNDLKEETESLGVSSIVALRDGVIREMTVTDGSALCHVGDAVKEGQLLVSGYTDCGICIRALQAKAEIIAETQRRLSAIYPTKYSWRSNPTIVNIKYSVIIGKNRINFFKGSGISGGTCAKIYEEKYLTLPGGFVLPVAIACEQILEYDTHTESIDNGAYVLSEFAAWYLPKQMSEGQICYAHQVYDKGVDFCRSDGIFICYEMIGVTRPEESIEEYE